uniref:Elongation of very long chain fatty acids protein n=1 Tax=Setaria digitata TaxID=48799 RepID=A0A915PYA5_9BILA
MAGGLEYEAQSSKEWMRQQRPLFMFLIVAYTLFVINAPRFQKGRKCRGLPTIIFCWNTFNALADAFLLLGLLPDFVSSFQNGFYSSLCLNGELYKNSRTGKALFTFHISKIWELFDTILVILDGREVDTLHVTHHIAISVLMVYSYQYVGAMARWIAVTNLAAHFALYSYLAAQSCVWKRRTRSACVISGIQLAQFPICLLSLLKIRQFLNAKKKCETGYNGPTIIIYATFFILFIQFYIKKYGRRNSNKEVLRGNSMNFRLFTELRRKWPSKDNLT